MSAGVIQTWNLIPVFRGILTFIIVCISFSTIVFAFHTQIYDAITLTVVYFLKI